MKAKLIIAVAVTVALMLVGPFTVLAEEKPAEKPPVITVGAEVRDFNLTNADGNDISWSKDIKGKVKYTILAFMNTACSNCLFEVQAANEVIKDMADAIVYAVVVDSRGKDSAKAYREVYKFEKVQYLVDPSFSLPPQYGYAYTPAVVVIDKSGKVIFSKGGYLPSDKDKFQEELKGLLK